MLGDRHQLDMGVAEILHVGNEFGGEFVPAVKTPVVVAPPRSGMQLVDADRTMLPVEVGAGSHPVAVFPGMHRFIGHAAGGLGPHEHLSRIRVGLPHQLAVPAEDFVFVGRAGGKAGDE
jgi:hypothetical protein